MTDRSGYWDVDRCTWVGAAPAYVVPPVPAPASGIAGPDVPEQRGTAEVPAVTD